MGCRIPYDSHDENGEQQVDPRARKREQTGGVRLVNEGIREERQVCDAGEDRADGEQDTERLPECKITDPMEEYRKQDKGRQDPEVSRNPEVCADEASGESPEDRERDTGEKNIQRFWTGRKQRTAQGTMEKNSRKYRMTRDQNGLFILNILLSFLYGPL